jgi:MerR family copper efflux transcriptional regulator
VQWRVKPYAAVVRIGELAELTGLSVRTLRFYEQAGVLEAPPRHASGYRDYDQDAPARLGFVKAAQAAGLTLAEIRQVIAVRADTGPPCEHVTALLQTRAADLDRRIAELTALRADVQRLRERAGRLDPATCGAASVCQVIPTVPGPA